jgi:hypothetical protein
MIHSEQLQPEYASLTKKSILSYKDIVASATDNIPQTNQLTKSCGFKHWYSEKKLLEVPC